MDGNRFDDMTRRVAEVASRRAVVKTVVAGLLGGALAGRSLGQAEAACRKYGRSCDETNRCCNGAICVDGACDCDTRVTIACQKSGGGTTCVEPCPPGQVLGSDCRCLCKTTLRRPRNGTCGDNGGGPNCSDVGDPCLDTSDCCNPFVCNTRLRQCV
jgi:hypothetical protein